MKTKQNTIQVILGITVLAIGLNKAEDTPLIQWNEGAQSQVMNSNELAKLDAVFPKWKIKQITWPSASEINTNKVVVDPNLPVQCMGWLTKFMKKEQLPTDLKKHLVAMKNWGLIREESEQKHLCDVFIVRYKKGSSVIHIQESPGNVVIAVVDERLATDPKVDHKDFVIEVATSILNEALKPDPNSENLHVFEMVRDGCKISRVSWLIESVIVILKDGQKYTDGVKKSKIGTSYVEAETDGKFVKFNVVKCVEGKRSHPDPYAERFSPQQEEQDDQVQDASLPGGAKFEQSGSGGSFADPVSGRKHDPNSMPPPHFMPPSQKPN